MPSFVNDVRAALARRFYVGLRRASHRMPAELIVPARTRLLVVAPHYDDETIACGGTLLLHRALGSAVHVVYLSDSAGATGDATLGVRIHAERRAEMAAVCAALGIASIAELGFADGGLVWHEAAIAVRLAEEIRAFGPQQLLCPFPLDGHADHQAAAVATARAAQRAGWQGEVLGYEVWSALWPNVAVDIGAVVEEKAALVRRYASQMGDRDYAAAIVGLNRYRGLPHRVAFAEAFHRCTPAQFAALAARLDTLG